MRITIQFDRLTCLLAHDDSSGRAEPYLWPFFFRIDADAIFEVCSDVLVGGLQAAKLTAEQRVRLAIARDTCAASLTGDPHGWFVRTNGAHGNLGRALASGESLQVPSAVGSVAMDLGLPALPQIREAVRVGFLAFLLEDDGTPNMDVAYRETFAPKVKSVLRQEILKGLLQAPASTSAFAGPLAPTLTWQAQSTLKAALTSAADDLIGASVRTFDLPPLMRGPQAFESHWSKATGSEDGAYRLTGSVRIIEP